MDHERDTRPTWVSWNSPGGSVLSFRSCPGAATRGAIAAGNQTLARTAALDRFVPGKSRLGDADHLHGLPGHRDRLSTAAPVPNSRRANW